MKHTLHIVTSIIITSFLVLGSTSIALAEELTTVETINELTEVPTEHETVENEEDQNENIESENGGLDEGMAVDPAEDTENTTEDIDQEITTDEGNDSGNIAEGTQNEESTEVTTKTKEKADQSAVRARIKAQLELQAKRRAELQARKEAHEAALRKRQEEEKQSTRIDARVALAKRIAVRLDNIHERLSAIIEKIQARSAELQESEITTDTTDAALVIAETHLDTASLHIREIEAMIETWVDTNVENGDSETLRATIQEHNILFKALVTSAKESLRSAYKSMKEAVRALKTIAKTERVPLETNNESTDKNEVTQETSLEEQE